MLDVSIRKKLGSDKTGALDVDVEFRLQEGVVVLFGHSGAGKTTILRLLSGILKPDEGRIALNESVWFDSRAGIHVPVQSRRVGFVFQEPLLLPHLTASGNVSFGIRAVTAAERRERAMDLLDLLGVAHASNRLPAELSGGEQQRVALARALAIEPQLVLLDEPLSAVDMTTRSRLLDEIAALQRRSGVPFLYVTHNPGEAVRLGDQVLLVHGGRILQSGSPLEVFAAPSSVPAARAVGTENVFAGTILWHRPEDGITAIGIGGCIVDATFNGLPTGSRVTVGIRSEDILVARERLTATSARNVM